MNAHVTTTAQSNAPSASYGVLYDEVTELGKLEGRGKSTRVELGFAVLGAAMRGSYDASKGSNDGKEIWEAYQKGLRETHVHATAGDSKASDAAQVSKLNAIAKLGNAAGTPAFLGVDAVQVLHDAVDVAKTTPSVKASAYDAMVTISRKQMKHPTQMTRDEIRLALQPADKEDKTELDELRALSKRMARLREGTDEKQAMPSAQLQQAEAAIENRIQELELSTKEAELIQLKVKAGVIEDPSLAVSEDERREIERATRGMTSTVEAGSEDYAHA
ncbi:MAG TPA: hypothetical protein VKQ30_20755 [Ktedonobacterales bacterium]|nr:hypothetical protein [Ktedonobacterales bacterium]